MQSDWITAQDVPNPSQLPGPVRLRFEGQKVRKNEGVREMRQFLGASE